MANYYRKLEDSGANYEEEEAQLWREPIYSRQRQRFDGRNHNNDAISSHIRRMPDEVWLIPANIDAKKILGEKKANLQRIEASTNTHMNYNENDAQIEMWGNRDELNEALKQWNTLAQNILDEELRRTREAKKNREERNKSAWAKPEKELTEKQRRKQKRRQERAEKEKEMAGPNYDNNKLPYKAHFVLPTNNEIPIDQILGKQEDVLNSIRMDTNCHIGYDPILKLVKIAGNESNLVEEATMRVKVLYLKSVASRSIPINLNDKSKRNGWVHHMIDIPDIPQQPYRVRIANIPNWYMLPHDAETQTAIKIFEPVKDGDPAILGKENDSKESPVDLETLQRIQLENVEGIKNALLQALGAIHLLDEEIKMRIRFGQICLTDYPKDALWPIDKLNARVLKSPKLNSKFVTCIATNNEQLKGLFEVVSQGDQQWEGSPFREYKIRAFRRPKSRGESKLDCVFDVKFKNDNKIGLWNATMNERNVLNINMACLDYDYSWNFSIRTAKRLSNDKFSPQGDFVYKLRLSQNNKLIYTNTEDIVVTSVCEKLKWKFWWGENYVVEITRYEHWNCDSKFQSISPGVEIVLGREPSEKTFFGVTFYKDSWERDFAENCNLSSGRVPEWHPIDFVEEEKSGGVDHLLNEIRNFLDVLHNNVAKEQRN